MKKNVLLERLRRCQVVHDTVVECVLATNTGERLAEVTPKAGGARSVGTSAGELERAAVRAARELHLGHMDLVVVRGSTGLVLVLPILGDVVLAALLERSAALGHLVDAVVALRPQLAKNVARARRAPSCPLPRLAYAS